MDVANITAKLGLFAGFAPKINGVVISNGWANYKKTIGLIGVIEATTRIGFGLEGVLNENGDGLIFLEVLFLATIPTPKFWKIWFLGRRKIFDWRHYF